MSKGYIVAIASLLAALVFGAPQLIHDFFPDLSRSAFLAVDAACLLLTLALVVVAIIAAIWEDDPAAHWRRKASGFKYKIAKRSALAASAVIFLAWWLWPRDPLSEHLPGFTSYAVVSLKNQPLFRKQYIFSLGPENGPRADLYMSASNQYTFSITDIHNETYPLELNVGSDGVPADKWIFFVVEIATLDNKSILRISINNNEAIRRTLPFVVDITNAEWKPAHLGADSHGNSGTFSIAEYAAWGASLSNKEIEKLYENVKGFYKL